MRKKALKKTSLLSREVNKIPTSLDEIKLSGDEISDSITVAGLISAGKETLIKKFPGVGWIWDWVEKAKDKAREEKMDILFTRYARKFNSIDEASAQLHTILETRGGQSLFTKLIQILDDGINDEEWVGLLANVLEDLSDIKFTQQFEVYAYSLAQMSRLSPQAIILLSKYEKWKSIHIQNTTTTSQQTLSGDWDSQVSSFFAREVGITDTDYKLRIAHSFRELEKEGLVSVQGHSLVLDSVGMNIYKIITRGN